MALKTYDAKKVVCTVGGIVLSGFSDGDLVMVERNEDTWTRQPGTDGEQTRSKTNDKSGKFTFSLMQTSPVNALLSALVAVDEATNAGVVPIAVKDTGGSSAYHGAQSWCAKPPVGEFKKEAGPREWVFDTAELVWFEGGN